jgi:hypothetical protein
MAVVITALILESTMSADAQPEQILSDLRVSRIEENLPAPRSAADRFLWSRFSNREREVDTPDIKLSAWGSIRDAHAAGMIALARKTDLEADALEQILNRIDSERRGLAIVPMEAYQTSQGARQIWIVVCRWEIQATNSNSFPNSRLGHVRIFAYDLTTLELVAFKTCM